MKTLNQNTGVFLQEDAYYTKEDILNLYRLQKVLLEEKNIVADLLECANIWQRYSSDLSASWLFFPINDEDILSNISSSYLFTNFYDYSGFLKEDCEHPKDKRIYMGGNVLKCGVCGEEFS